MAKLEQNKFLLEDQNFPAWPMNPYLFIIEVFFTYKEHFLVKLEQENCITGGT